MMFIPNTTGQHRRRMARNAFGKTVLGAPVGIELSIVKLGEVVVPSSVRADQSATRGAAEIETLDAKLLLPAYVTVEHGDVITVLGMNVEIAGITPRLNALGDVDHFEITGNLKGSL
jgi:hypothetical protein